MLNTGNTIDIEPINPINEYKKSLFNSVGQYKAPVDGFNQQELPNGMVLKHFEDGSAIFEPNQLPVAEKNSGEFYGNIIDQLDPNEIRNIGNILCDLIKKDDKTQEPYRKAIADIIKLLGISLGKNESPDPATVNVYSTTLFETNCHSIATAVAVLLPSQDIAKSVVYGQSTERLDECALRQGYFYDFYLNEEIPDFRKDMIRTLFWANLTGSAYRKVYIDPIRDTPTSRFIRPEDFILNRDYSTHHASPRKTHVLRILERDFNMQVDMGFYSKNWTVEFQDSLKIDNDNNQIQEILDHVSGIDPVEDSDGTYNGGYILFECHCLFLIKSDRLNREQRSLPYIITLDSATGNVVRVERNWKKEDPNKKAREFFANYSFFPSLDGEGYGIMHYGGSSAQAATALTRLIIKSSTYASFPAGVYAAGTRVDNNTITPQPGQYVPLSTGGVPIDQVLSSLPYRDVSPMVLDLKNSLEESIKAPVGIINNTISEMAPRAPTGSVLAILESLQRVPNLILQGFHFSFAQELKLFKERFYEWMTDDQVYPFLVPGGEHVVMREDFSPKYQIFPSSDPSMQNSTYKLMLSEILLNRAMESPQLHNLRNALLMFYKNLGVSQEEIDKILLPEPPQEEQTIPTDPVTENANSFLGKPLKAFVFQDHSAHITVHQQILADPNQDQQILAAIQAHIKEHESMNYLLEMQAKMQIQLPENIEELTPDEQNHVAMVAAQIVLEEQKRQQEQNPTPQPVDPGTAMLEDARLKAESAQQKLSFEAEKTEKELELEVMKLEFQKLKLEMESAQKEKELNLKMEVEALKGELSNKKMELDFAAKERDSALKEKNALETLIQKQGVMPNV